MMGESGVTKQEIGSYSLVREIFFFHLDDPRLNSPGASEVY